MVDDLSVKFVAVYDHQDTFRVMPVAEFVAELGLSGGGGGGITTVIANDDVTVDAFNGTTIVLYTALTAARTVTLPPASGPSQIVIVKDATGSSGSTPITIAGVGGDLVSTDTLHTVTDSGLVVALTNDKTSDWVSVSEVGPVLDYFIGLVAAGAVSSVNGQTGTVVLTAADVGADAAGTADDVGASVLIESEAYTDARIHAVLDAESVGISAFGLRFWMDASDPSLITLDGGSNVQTLIDRSGSGLDFQEAALSGGPTVDSGVLNGLDALNFDGTQSLANANRPAWRFLHQGDSTVFMVCREVPGSDDAPSYLSDLGYGAAPAYGYGLVSSPSARGVHVSVAAGDYTVDHTTNATMTDDEWTLATIQVAPHASLGARSTVYLNGDRGTSVGGNDSSSGLIEPHNADGDMMIGAAPSGFTSHLVGGIAEIIAYDRVLSETECARVELYLNEKWFGASPPAAGRLAGVHYTYAASVNYDATNLDTDGVAIYEPTIGDELLDAWIEVKIADLWGGGGDAYADIGTFDDNHGWFYGAVGGALQAGLNVKDSGEDLDTYTGMQGLLVHPFADGLTLSNTGQASGRFAPGKFTSANPIKVVVSNDGSKGGGAPGASAGTLTVYLTVCTPLA